jgi:hypothetical protein
MRSRWLLPAAVVGFGGLGLLVLSDRGLEALEWLASRVKDAPRRFQEWNEAAQEELERLQAAVDSLAEAFESAQ